MTVKAHIPAGIGTLSKGNMELCTSSVKKISSNTLLFSLSNVKNVSCWCLCAFKMQQACGFEYTSKLQRMFQDIGVSKDLNEQFKKHLTNSEPLDCK